MKLNYWLDIVNPLVVDGLRFDGYDEADRDPPETVTLGHSNEKEYVMTKANRTTVLLAVAALIVVAGLAYPKAGLIKVFTAAGSGEVLNPDVKGLVVMNFHDSTDPRTEVQVQVRGLEPGVTYGVQVEPGTTIPLAFTANNAGHGHWRGVASTFDITQQNPVVLIFVFDGDQNAITHVSFDELRAIGCLSEDCTIGESCSVTGDCDDNFLCTVDTCDGGFCFHAPLDCGENSFCSLSRFNCDTGCVELDCTTAGETGCCNTFDPCPGSPGICPCPDGLCGCEGAPCP